MSKKAKCGKTATKISWNTAGPTAPALIGFTETSGVTLQPGADWVTLGTVTFTASTAFRYQPALGLGRSSFACPGSTPNTAPYNSTVMEVATRFVVNGVVIPNLYADDGTRDFSALNLSGMMQAWSGPVTLTVLARSTSSSNGAAPVIAPCAIDTGTTQFFAFAYSV